MSTSEDLPVTIVVTRTVRPGRERDYEEVLTGASAAARRYPGHMGVSVIRPRDPGRREYTLIFRFDTVDNLRGWETSEDRAAWAAKAAPLCEGDTSVQKLSGLEAWFS